MPESSVAFNEEIKFPQPISPFIPPQIQSENELYWQNYDQMKGGKRFKI